MELIPVVYAWLYLLVTVMAEPNFFCRNLYNDITTRDPLRFSVADNSPVGTVLKSFDRHLHLPNPVVFSSGDLAFFDFDKSTFQLVTKAPLYPKADQTLQIFGNCSEHIAEINYGFQLSLTVLLDVIDVNDPPIFSNLPAYLRIKESQRVGSQLYTVVIKEGFDVKADFATTILSITNVTSEGFPNYDVSRFFTLNSAGTMFLQNPIDYETQPRSFEIAIHAEDLGDPPLTADSTLTFYLQDVDDMNPVFQHESHSVSVIGEKPITTTECHLTKPEILAEDQDVMVKAEVHYEISRGPAGEDWRSLFKLEQISGRLCQLKTITRTVPDAVTGRLTFANYTFRIKGYQVDNRRKYDLADLNVHVTDSNQHAPTFDRKLYRATIPEFPGAKVGQEVIMVKAEDKDHGENNIFTYNLEGPEARWFTIDADTGSITIADATKLDREIYDSFQFKVKATESRTLERMQTEARVVITLEDLNDHAPVFNQHRYSYNVKDSLVPGSAIHQSSAAISAHDRDSGDNGRILYSISSLVREQGIVTFNDYGRFTIDPDDGTLRLSGSLNDLRRRRDHPVYILELTATDQAVIKEDRNSVTVRATVRIHEANDFMPTVVTKRGALRVNETAPVGSVIYKLEVKDRDGDEDIYLRYKISRGNHGNTFKMSSEGKVVIKKPLDRETTEFYKLRIHVTDGKHAKTTSLRIQVLDINDNTPVFSQEQYIFAVDEDPPLGMVIGHISATDADSGAAGTITYSVRFSPGASTISITPDGDVRVRQKSILWDREKNSHIRLKVFASDSGSPKRKSQADILIRLVDVNDNPPAFTAAHYFGWVNEDNADPKPQFVTMDIPINATDRDANFRNRDIRYTLTGPGSSEIFSIENVRADIFTTEIGQLDAERKQEYQLTLRATDIAGAGLSSTAKLTIKVRDRNDNTPLFIGNHVFKVLVNAERGHKVGMLNVVDRDITPPNNYLIYILKEGGHGKFAVNFQTGDITLAERLDTDEVLPVYELRIQALDGGVPRLSDTTTVTIRVPVNRPPIIRTNTTLSLDEGLPPGSLVAAMFADDVDSEENEISGNIEFFIMDETVPFKVSPHGIIRTKDLLDRELKSSYEFQLYVRDEGRPPMTSSALITVNVGDINDHAPQFVHHIYEGTVVEDDRDPKPQQNVKLRINISAFDQDATAIPGDLKYTLHGDGSDMFTIDSSTGEMWVSTKGFGFIDREETESFTFMVRATDGGGYGLYSEAKVIIHVIDVNDVAPRFKKRTAMLEVSRHVEVGQVLGILGAVDGDATEPNNNIMYTLENDPYGKFAVDSHTGDVRALIGVFYPPRQESYRLTVAATDMGYPPLTTEINAEIHVNKTDFNDHKPEFYGPTMFYVNEQVPIGTLIATVSVRDEDHPDNEEEIALSLQTDHSVPFKIDKRTGEIRSTTVLDYDAGGRTFMFTVIARDSGDPQRSSEVVVGVILDDVNDNPPRFTQNRYHHKVHTIFPAGTVVATPFAYDDIDSSSSVYQYVLIGEDVGMYFYINENSGVVRTTAKLADIKGNRVEYKLVAKDIYNSRLQTEAELVIDVFKQTNSSGCCCKVLCDKQP